MIGITITFYHQIINNSTVLGHPGGKRNILAEGPKTKTGWQDCYFDKKFKRIFEGEAIDKTKKKRFWYKTVVSYS